MKNPIAKKVLWVLGGAVAGFAWYYYVGCATGTCPISSNPYISTGYGALMGFLASGSFSSPRKSDVLRKDTPDQR
jgi:hypothetical protein